MKPSSLSWLQRATHFESIAHDILGTHEAANKSRVILLENSYVRLQLLNLRQDDLLRQSLRCAENGLFRAAHVMCWAACMDYIEEKLGEDGMAKLRAAYPSWPQTPTVMELAEHVPEFQLIEALRKVGLSTKNETKALQGLLNKRNECAHPTDYLPKLNETLGYIAEALQRIEKLATKSLI